jgi:hypothetical protein
VNFTKSKEEEVVVYGQPKKSKFVWFMGIALFVMMIAAGMLEFFYLTLVFGGIALAYAFWHLSD